MFQGFPSSGTSGDKSVWKTVKYEDIGVKIINDDMAHLNLLSLLPEFLHIPRVGWLGTMQAAMVGNHPGKSSIVFLLMIDLSASDDSCINSTLSYLSSQASKQGCTPVITFDQPLW